MLFFEIVVIHLVLELLTKLQANGEEQQCVIEPGNHTLHLVNLAHFKTIVFVVTEKKTSKNRMWQLKNENKI